MKRIGLTVVAILLAVTMVFSPSVMAMAEARSGGQPIMPEPIMPTPPIECPATPPIEGSAFKDAIEIAERFLQRNPDGTLTLNMPGRAIKTIGEDVYAQLQAGLARANEKVSAGYLKFDENFDAYVTERYLDKVKANMALHQQSLHQELQLAGISASEISVSRSGNSITVDFGILGGGDTGVNKATQYWWGFKLWFCRDETDNLALGVGAIATFLAIYAALAKSAAAAVAAAIVYFGVLKITVACDGQGVRVWVAGHIDWGGIPFWVDGQPA